MTQQNELYSEDSVYKKKLFYDNGVRFVKVKARVINDYKPPTPSMKTHVNQTLQASAGMVTQGTSHYTTSLTLLFYSKKEYADWLQFIGATHKYYDEKGSIYVGIVTGEPDVQTAEIETKYIVTITLSLIRKQDYEFRHTNPFIDVKGHWSEQYVDEMQKRGLIATYDANGDVVQYFTPDRLANRGEITAFLIRSYKYMDRILRGF